MKKKLISLIALFLSAIMLMGILASCTGNTPTQDETESSGSESSSTSKEESSTPTEGNTTNENERNDYYNKKP